MTNGNSADIKTLIDKIENCGFECEAGQLEMCIDWQILKNKLLSVCADGGKGEAVATLTRTGFCCEVGLLPGSSSLPVGTHTLYAAPQAECAPREANESAYQRGYLDGMAKGRRDAQIDAAECAPRDAQSCKHCNVNYPYHDLDCPVAVAPRADAEKDAALTQAVAEIVRYQTFTGRTAWDIKIRDKSLKNGDLLYRAPRSECAPRDFLLGYDDLGEAIWGTAPREAQPVAYIAGADEYGPKLLWKKHWVELIGQSLYLAAPTPERAQESAGVRLSGEDIQQIHQALSMSSQLFDGELTDWRLKQVWKALRILAANKEPQP